MLGVSNESTKIGPKAEKPEKAVSIELGSIGS